MFETSKTFFIPTLIHTVFSDRATIVSATICKQQREQQRV
ncbi:hypothetical protein AVDCRST_MAG94-4038 [uncultured Leptolyngbya sp.]|uniref:Uncharacterized protein n=1 Tax=uncultured Leptolyngbya sp. TaxID=332963 RepID=A0A6J4MUY7_9CYAN|nr:hypothetical protein AVDCRST_MAG94-4038 [uncultured Leptolyngbya sp.]